MTKADEGVAPTVRGTAHIVTPGGSGSVGVAELTHELVRGQLSEYLDGSLGESDRRRVDGRQFLSAARFAARGDGLPGSDAAELFPVA